MAGTQSTEKVATFDEKFKAIKAQMLSLSQIKKKYTEAEVDVMVRNSLVEYANDKVEFAVRGALRRNAIGKVNKAREVQGLPPMSPEEWETQYRKTQRKLLADLGYAFALSKEDKAIQEAIVEKVKQAAAEEMTKIASEAMRKILQSVN